MIAPVGEPTLEEAPSGCVVFQFLHGGASVLPVGVNLPKQDSLVS
jgi:hypothetical protein